MEEVLIALVIVLIIVGAIAYIVSLVPFIPEWLKTAIYVLLAALVLVALIKMLWPLAGPPRRPLAALGAHWTAWTALGAAYLPAAARRRS